MMGLLAIPLAALVASRLLGPHEANSPSMRRTPAPRPKRPAPSRKPTAAPKPVPSKPPAVDDAVRAMVERAQAQLEPLRNIDALRELTPQGKPTSVGPARNAHSPEREPARSPSTSREEQEARAAALAARAAADAEAPPQERGEVPPPPAPVPAPAPVQRQAPPPQERGEVPPEPTPTAEPVPVLPEGYDPAAARRRAQEVANHVRNKSYGYSRKLLAAWQTAAGMDDDGVYGPMTRDALRWYGAANVPSPLFRKRHDGTIIKDSDPDATYIPPEAR